MTDVANPSVAMLVISAVSMIAGSGFSKLAENWGAERREAAKQRREDDKAAVADNERLRERCGRYEARIATLEAVLIAKEIPLPPRISNDRDQEYRDRDRDRGRGE